jgi:hypothetical protein
VIEIIPVIVLIFDFDYGEVFYWVMKGKKMEQRSVDANLYVIFTGIF